jgi:hypothetical protein
VGAFFFTRTAEGRPLPMLFLPTVELEERSELCLDVSGHLPKPSC